MSSWVQISLFEAPTQYDPLAELVTVAGAYWTTSRKRIREAIRQNTDTETLAEIVRDEYCPYGFAGHYGAERQLPGLCEWEFWAQRITYKYLDADGNQQSGKCNWKQFADAIRRHIWNGGRYGEEPQTQKHD